MNKQYIYPQNMRASATLWLWSLKDFAIIVVGALFSALVLATTKIVIPAVLTAAFAFLSIRNDETTMLFFLPLIVYMGVMSNLGEMEIDTVQAQQTIVQNMSAEEKAKLQHLEDVMVGIGKEFQKRKLNSRVITAISKERQTEIIEKALDWFSEHFEAKELLDILHEYLDMTDAEIDLFGFDFSDLEQDNRFSVFCMKDYEDAVFFTTAIPNDFYCAASTYHYYIKDDVGRKSLDSLAGCFADQQFIDEQVFSVLCAAMSKDNRIASLIEFDFDSNQLNYCDNADGIWQTYDLNDISEAVRKSNSNNDLNYASRQNIFIESIAEKEISSTAEETDTESESPSMRM